MDIELTKTEIDNLSQAMKKPEFINLLKDYVDEISDPKNKAEHEAYLKQLEEAGEMPQGRKLLRPLAHSCIKTVATSKRKIKCFINLCQATELLPPTLERKSGGGNWQVPYAMGHPRHDQDNKGINCLTFDCAYHPEAFKIAGTSQQFLKLLCDTALKAANIVLQPQGEQVSEDYKLMKNLKCKGGTPGSIMVNEYRMQNPSEPVPEREKTYKLSEEGPKLYKELIATQMKQDLQTDVKVEEEKEKVKIVEDEKVEEVIVGIVQPKFKITYSSPVDLGEFMDNRVKSYKRPKEIVVTVQVPRIENLKDCKIDIKDKLVIFEAKDTYYLEVKLTYDVEEEKANAKFDRKRKEVKICLPVVQAPEVKLEISEDVPLEVDEPKEPIKEIKEELKETQGEIPRVSEVVNTYKFSNGKIIDGLLVFPQDPATTDLKQLETTENPLENIENSPEPLENLIEGSKKEPHISLPAPSCIGLKSQLLFQLL